MQTSEALVQVFTRAPVPGRVKTRLIPALGEQGASELHSELTARLLQDVIAGGHNVELWCDPYVDHPFFDQYEIDRIQQQGSDLGNRMMYALNHGLERSKKVVLIGTDLPAIDTAYVRKALGTLDDNQVVLGPAEDGGYGLIGVVEEVPDIFAEVSWGTSDVLSTTCARMNALRISYALLPLVWDVDTPEDLPRYKKWLDDAEADQAFGT